MIAKPIPGFEGADNDLRLSVQRLKDGVPQCHIRYADGEFQSMFGRVGPNADGQEHLPETLGVQLRETLFDISRQPLSMVSVGADWRTPPETYKWLVDNELTKFINWTPPQLWVTGILAGQTLEALRAIVSAPGKRWLVSNHRVCRTVCCSLNSLPLVVHISEAKLAQIEAGSNRGESRYHPFGAFGDMARVEQTLRNSLAPGDIVLWCAGLGCKPSLWRMFRDCPGTTHLDFGAFFDLAAGLESRTWMTKPPDDRGWCYRREYMPRLKGEMPW